MKTNLHLWSYLSQFFVEWEMFQTKVLEKIKTHILCSITFFENRAVYEIMWKYTAQPRGEGGGRRWQYNTAHAQCMLDDWGYILTLRICNIFCFYLATMVTRTRLDATFICTLPVLFKENYTHARRVFAFIPTIIIEFALKKIPICDTTLFR